VTAGAATNTCARCSVAPNQMRLPDINATRNVPHGKRLQHDTIWTTWFTTPERLAEKEVTLALHILGWLALYTLATGLLMLWAGPRWHKIREQAGGVDDE
jgi:hypothetical protein